MRFLPGTYTYHEKVKIAYLEPIPTAAGTYTYQKFGILEPIPTTTWNLYLPSECLRGIDQRLDRRRFLWITRFWNLYLPQPGTYTYREIPQPGTYTYRSLEAIRRRLFAAFMAALNSEEGVKV